MKPEPPPTVSRQRRAVRRAGRLGLLVAGCAVGLLLAEGLLRVLGVSYPLPYLPDPWCGSRLQPGFEAWFSKEGGAYVQVNRAGFRDREHTLAKPPNTVRIAVLGDSFAEAVQVPLEKTFWFTLEQELQDRRTFGAKRVEVLNFGLSGHGTAQQLQILRHYVWPYRPDIVLLAFVAGNDVRNNSPQLEPYRVRPFFRIADGQLVLDDSFLQHPDYRKATSRSVRWKVALINRSRILQLANEWYNRLRNRQAAGPQNSAGVEDAAVFQEPTDARWRDAWEITERLIEEIDRETKSHGARFCLVTVTQDADVHPDPLVRKRCQEQLGVADLSYPERRIQALGKRAGFAVISLADPMRRLAETHQVYLHGFTNTTLGSGHWNESGHQTAGRLIAEAMSSLSEPSP